MDRFGRITLFEDLLRILCILFLFLGCVDGRVKKRRLKHDEFDQPSAIPEFLPVPDNITVHEGEFAVLKCYIYNLGPKMVIWRRTEEDFPHTIGLRVFTPNPRVNVEHITEAHGMRTYWNLQIDKVRPEDAGTYECQISAKKIYTFNVTLNVLDPIEYDPDLTIRGTEYVSLLENIHLVCNATGVGEAPSGIDWFFDGNPIREWNPRVEILKHKPVPGRSYISELIVEKVTMADRGNYVCRSSDRIVKGMKVHVLNDIRGINDPKRNSGPETYEAIHRNGSGIRLCYSSSQILITLLMVMVTFATLAR